MKNAIQKLLLKLICFLTGQMPYRTIAVINDCCGDDNGRGRIGSKISALFGFPVSAEIAVAHTLEVAVNILDQLKVIGKTAGLILANIAPRDLADGKTFTNGTHFGFCWIGNTLLVSTISGYTLSLVKKFRLADSIFVLDLERSVDMMVHAKLISLAEGDEIKLTQFRSCYFQPLVAKAILLGIQLPGERLPISAIQDAPLAIAVVDIFGNRKTTLTLADIDVVDEGQQAATLLGTFPFYTQLCKVPEGVTAIVIGSSGFNEHLLEINVKGRGKNPLTATVGTLVLK